MGSVLAKLYKDDALSNEDPFCVAVIKKIQKYQLFKSLYVVKTHSQIFDCK